MKRRILALLLSGLLSCALLTGCGGAQAKTETPAQSSPAAASAAEEGAAASSAAQASSAPELSAEGSAQENEAEAAPEETVSPYAWQGLEDMPQCAYLDALCSYHYYREYTSYVMGYATKNVEAVDGANTFKGTDSSRTYSVDGRVITFNDSSKNYMEYNMDSSIAETAAEQIEKNKAEGTNLPGRAFVGTGSGVIPEYSETEDDQTEYEYYEYNYPGYEEYGTKMVERFYLKDGDVFAVWKETTMGENTVGTTEVVQSMSGEIPKGTFDIPSTDGYEELKIGDN